MRGRFETFALAIARINRFIQKIKAMEMTELGLKGSHTMVLYFLGKNPQGLTSAQLSALCSEDKAAVSRALSELLSLDFVRKSSSGGRREYREKLYLTENGERAFEYICGRINELLDIGGAGLTDEQREQFYSALEIISENLESYGCDSREE